MSKQSNQRYRKEKEKQLTEKANNSNDTNSIENLQIEDEYNDRGFDLPQTSINNKHTNDFKLK